MCIVKQVRMLFIISLLKKNMKIFMITYEKNRLSSPGYYSIEQI